MNRSLKSSVYTLLLFISFMGYGQSISSQNKPNILFIFADDQTFESLGAINNNEIRTPNLDRLANQGTLFTHAFNMGSWSPAVCLASRAMLNKGQFVWKAQKSAYDLSFVGKNEKTDKEQVTPWSILMKKAGYDTYMTGKWHVNAR